MNKHGNFNMYTYICIYVYSNLLAKCGVSYPPYEIVFRITYMVYRISNIYRFIFLYLYIHINIFLYIHI